MKNLWKNREKSSIFRHVIYKRLGGASGLPFSSIYRREIQKIADFSAFYRRFFGIIMALRFFSVFDLTVQILSAFFEKSNGYIFYPMVDFKSEA